MRCYVQRYSLCRCRHGGLLVICYVRERGLFGDSFLRVDVLRRADHEVAFGNTSHLSYLPGLACCQLVSPISYPAQLLTEFRMQFFGRAAYCM